MKKKSSYKVKITDETIQNNLNPLLDNHEKNNNYDLDCSEEEDEAFGDDCYYDEDEENDVFLIEDLNKFNLSRDRIKELKYFYAQLHKLEKFKQDIIETEGTININLEKINKEFTSLNTSNQSKVITIEENKYSKFQSSEILAVRRANYVPEISNFEFKFNKSKNKLKDTQNKDILLSVINKTLRKFTSSLITDDEKILNAARSKYKFSEINENSMKAYSNYKALADEGIFPNMKVKEIKNK